MVKIEYKKQKICVPTSWDDIPLSKYETFYQSKPTDNIGRVDLIAMVCGVDSQYLRQWPASAFNIIVEYVSFIFSDDISAANPVIDAGGVKYAVAIEDELSLGAWVDAEAIQKEGVAVLSNVLAIVCRPAGELYDDKLNETRAAMFAAMPVSKVLGVLSFFLQCKHASDARMTTYTALNQLADRLPRNISHFVKLGAGIKLFQIWQIMRYCVLTRLLRYQLARHLRSYSIVNIKTQRIAHSVN